MLFDELRDADTSMHVLIALGEIDNIGTSDNVPRLGRCNSSAILRNTSTPTAKVGLVGITNDSTFRDSLDPQVKSTLCEPRDSLPAV